MKIKILVSLLMATFLLSGCVLGGLIEANEIEGTWVSDNFYNTNSNSYYVYYDFNSISVDLDGDQKGKYRIRGYRDTFWWNSNYNSLEEGSYSTDFISGKITLIPYSGPSRVLNYSLSDNSLIFTDYNWWNTNQIVLKKL